jgi:hypothetical protein
MIQLGIKFMKKIVKAKKFKNEVANKASTIIGILNAQMPIITLTLRGSGSRKVV